MPGLGGTGQNVIGQEVLETYEIGCVFFVAAPDIVGLDACFRNG